MFNAYASPIAIPLIMQALSTLLAFLIALGILVSFHEFGHYFAARCCGVKVLRFAIGFGKPLFTFRDRQQTEWVIAILPLGGYVKLMNGRDPEQTISIADQASDFDRKPLWQRSLIVAAGPIANFVLALILLSVIYFSGVPQLPAQLQTPPATSLAAKAGLSAGDRVIGWRSLANEENVGLGADTFTPVVSWNALRWYLLDGITAHNGFELQVENGRSGKSVVRFLSEQLPEVRPKADVFLELGLFPLVANPPQWFELQLAPVQAVSYAAERVWLITKVSTRMMLGLVTGSTSLAQIGGPLSIADMAGKSAQVGWQPYLAFLALMSISIGLLNLIPLPMLDGGQLLYDAWELVSGRRLPEALQAVLQKSSFILLTFLMLFALFNDFQRYLSP